MSTVQHSVQLTLNIKHKVHKNWYKICVQNLLWRAFYMCLSLTLSSINVVTILMITVDFIYLPFIHFFPVRHISFFLKALITFQVLSLWSQFWIFLLLLLQLCGDIAKDLKVVSQLVSERSIDESLSLWLEVGTIKPVLGLYVAVADFIDLKHRLSPRCVYHTITTCYIIWYRITYRMIWYVISYDIVWSF